MRIALLARERNNNFNLLRFLAASAVIFSHSYALTGRGLDEPLLRWSDGATYLGLSGVTVFFIISGFLVSKSFTERKTLAAFAAARALRIYPALVAATLFSAVLAVALGTLPWREFLSDPQTQHFVVRNSFGWRIEYFLPGAFLDNPYPRAVNGSLWSVPIELSMYVACALAGTLGLLYRRVAFNIVFVAGFVIFTLRPDWFTLYNHVPHVRLLALAFATGSLAWVNRDVIPLSPWAAAVALLVLVVNPGEILRGPFSLILLAYVVLTFALHPTLRFAAFNRIGDYSYGLYVYAFPIQQALVNVKHDLDPFGLFAAAFALTLLMAMASWHGMEKPALGLKSRFRPRLQPA
ncbi:MAG: acyltransferase [Betaproteobacteria bacterium]|nr:MAG: acyltransferase [Betaproteobacteria bacterium]